VALSIARQRLLTATFPYYRIAGDDPDERNPAVGFAYKTVPHITLKCIAQNPDLDPDKVKGKSREEIEAIIQANAPQETLYDQPEVDGKRIRVSGPFTVEAIPPPVEQITPPSPIGGEPETAEAEPARSEDPTAHLPMLVELLRKDGVTFPDNRRVRFEHLSERTGGVLHAEGEAKGDTDMGRIAVSFGPFHGPVTVGQVEDGLSEAVRGGFDSVIFCGFAFDGSAQSAISADPNPRVHVHLAHIRPDVMTTDSEGKNLLKTTAASQLFTVFGEPDVALKPATEAGIAEAKDGEWVVELLGVDVYDPLTGEVSSSSADRIAAWFLDTDYDNRTFCICQAFFPNQSAWEKIERALRGTLNEDRFDMLTGRVSLPFVVGEHKRVAAKVVDQRGNEVMRVVPVTR